MPKIPVKKYGQSRRRRAWRGEHLGKPPYGYQHDPADKKKWILDEEAAAVVKRIFDLCVAGNGPMRIAKILKADKVLTTRAYYAKKKGKALPDDPYHWNENRVVGILERMDYCRHTVNFKSYSKSHKLKKRIPTLKEQQAIFRNTQKKLYAYYAELLSDFKDVVFAQDVVKLTGYAKATINGWCAKGHLKHFEKDNKYYIPKVFLVEFFCSSYFRSIIRKTSWHIQTINEFHHLMQKEQSK